MEFLVLGPLEVRNGERTVRLGAAKQRALLGVLLLHANETVSTARLVDELWGERPPATAEKLVQGYVHALRKQLGDGVVQTQAPGYRLTVEGRDLDVAEFERMIAEARTASPEDALELRRRALALWRGPPLTDVVLEGPERHNLDRLSELRLTTQIERIDAELELGRDDAARRGARGDRRGASVPGARSRAADARALPVRPTGGSPRGVSVGSPQAQRRARARTGSGAPRPGGRDPSSGRRACGAG